MSSERHLRPLALAGTILTIGLTIGLAIGLAMGLGSCSQPKGEVFEPLPAAVRWPAPPETARIAYVGQLATDRDLKRGRSFGEVLLGEDATRSMLSPYGVCTDGGERVFVSDSNGQLIHVFDLDTRRYTRWPDAKSATPLAQPLGIAWDPQGRLLVADAAAGHVAVLGPNGRVRDTIGSDVLQRPTGIAVDAATGFAYVADAASHQVLVFDRYGTLQHALGARGVDAGQFNFPTNVALDSRGHLYVADSLNFRVQVFDTDLRPLRQVGSQGDRPGFFSQPKGLAIDRDDNLYVVDAHFESVQIFDVEGRLLLSFGHEGHGPGEFWLPAGAHADASGRIWIADSYNRRVQVFEILGEAE